MLTYNNRLKQLILPEYGRNIQNMVDHCLTIDDREARNACAASIVRSMKILFPCTGDPQEYERKLWDHLMIMSGHKLDIDSPFGPIELPAEDQGPDPVPMYAPSKLPFRHYGLLVTQLIDTASGMEPGEARDELTLLIANQMKKDILSLVKDGVDDARIFKDLRQLSHGVLNLDPAVVHLNEYKPAPQPSKKKKKK